jgi:methane/ammonia monooxygenase subunit C
MAVTTEALKHAKVGAAPRTVGWTSSHKNYLLAWTVIFLWFNLFVRWYEEVYGWSAGLDAFAPEFKTYWMNWLYTEFVLEVTFFAYIGAYLWKTRDKNMAALSAGEELNRYMYLLVWLVVYGYAIYWGASFYTEQDGTWHQTVIRDTDFTPSHIIEFYMSYPIYILVGWGTYMYAKTRLPYFAAGHSLPFLIAIVGPFMILPNVGLNEWGHTFWWMEELFVAPLHYGFVFFGWMALGAMGLFSQIWGRMAELLKPELAKA